MIRSQGEQRRTKNNPWEILVVAALFFFPGLFMLFRHGPLIAIQQSFRYAPSAVTAISEHGAHIFGILAIAVALAFLTLYFYLRREIARDTTIQKLRWR
jgi:drug/metabolite transporter (DMT)-like permease